MEPNDIVTYGYNFDIGREIKSTKLDSIPIFQKKQNSSQHDKKEKLSVNLMNSDLVFDYTLSSKID